MSHDDDSKRADAPPPGSILGAPNADATLPGEEDGVAGERFASLPDEVVPDPSTALVAQKVEKKFSPLETPEPGLRESLIAGMTGRRTTLYEVGEVARRLSILAPGVAAARRESRRIVLSFAIGLTVALLATMVFAGGTWRLLLGILGGTGVAALATFAALRGLARFAARGGAREIPGPALLWVGGAVLTAIGLTVAFTWSLSEATEPLAGRLSAPSIEIKSQKALKPSGRADANVKRDHHVRVRRGVLYVPPAFKSEDGQFDLVIHYHGNVDMVEKSAARTQLNALMLIYNYGEGSGKYSKPLLNPRAFDAMLDGTEKRAAELGLETPRVRRIALSSWSAGYGALYRILESRSRADRIDAVLMQDSMHGSYYGAAKGKVSELSLRPFVRFARRAAAGEKLMVVTHSAIETEGYPDTTKSASALLEDLSIERTKTNPANASPPPVEMPVVLRAFPDGRRWLQVINTVHQKGLQVLGCDGKTQGDHIAHLGQISETVLPPLIERWNAAPDKNTSP